MPSSPTRRLPTHAALALAAALVAWSPPSAAAGGLPLATASPEEQAALDLTPVPPDRGAVFVPTVSRPDLEPLVYLEADGERVADGPSGRRILVPPGTYDVVFGQGPLAWRARTSVEVVAGQTTLARGFFSALRVTSIDGLDRRTRVEYVLASADGARVYGPAQTTTSAAVSATRTWVVPPGNYTLALGDDPTALKNRVLVTLAPGERLDYRMVVTEDGLVRTELADRALKVKEEVVEIDWVVGGALAFDRAEGELGGFSGDALRADAFTRFRLGLDFGDHLVDINLGIEEAWVGLEHVFGRGLPFQKITDYVQIDALYTFRLAEIVGPYVRAVARTSLFPTEVTPEEDTVVVTERTDGTIGTEIVSGGDTVTLMDRFAPTRLHAGGGVGVSLWDDDVFTAHVRGGVAVRQDSYGEDGGRAYVSSGSGALVLRELDRLRRAGVEATVDLALRLGHLVTIQSRLDGFSAFDELFGDDDLVPTFSWDSTVALRLSTWASFVYQVVVHRDDPRLDDLQIRQSLSVRFNHAIF